MKAYGAHRSDCGCCYGHFKYGAKLMDRDHALSDSAKAGDRARKKTARQEAQKVIRVSFDNSQPPEPQTPPSAIEVVYQTAAEQGEDVRTGPVKGPGADELVGEDRLLASIPDAVRETKKPTS